MLPRLVSRWLTVSALLLSLLSCLQVFAVEYQTQEATPSGLAFPTRARDLIARWRPPCCRKPVPPQDASWLQNAQKFDAEIAAKGDLPTRYNNMLANVFKSAGRWNYPQLSAEELNHYMDPNFNFARAEAGITDALEHNPNMEQGSARLWARHYARLPAKRLYIPEVPSRVTAFEDQIEQIWKDSGKSVPSGRPWIPDDKWRMVEEMKNDEWMSSMKWSQLQAEGRVPVTENPPLTSLHKGLEPGNFFKKYPGRPFPAKPYYPRPNFISDLAKQQARRWDQVTFKAFQEAGRPEQPHLLDHGKWPELERWTEEDWQTSEARLTQFLKNNPKIDFQTADNVAQAFGEQPMPPQIDGTPMPTIPEAAPLDLEEVVGPDPALKPLRRVGNLGTEGARSGGSSSDWSTTEGSEGTEGSRPGSSGTKGSESGNSGSGESGNGAGEGGEGSAGSTAGKGGSTGSSTSGETVVRTDPSNSISRWLHDVDDGSVARANALLANRGLPALDRIPYMSIPKDLSATSSYTGLSQSLSMEIPADSLSGISYVTTEGTLVSSEGSIAGAELAGGLRAGIGAVDAASTIAGETGIIAADAGLVAAGPASLGISLAVAALMTAASFVVMPLIESLQDHRKTTRLHGFITDIDGDGKPDYVKDFYSKIDPNNPFLYHKEKPLQTFFNNLFKKKEKMKIDFQDETWGDVHFEWKGNAAAGQNTVLGILESDKPMDEKFLRIKDILEDPNKAGNKKKDKIRILADTDHDHEREEIKIKYKGKRPGDGKMEMKGDIDGDGDREKCKWSGSDGESKFEHCHDSATDHDHDHE